MCAGGWGRTFSRSQLLARAAKEGSGSAVKELRPAVRWQGVGELDTAMCSIFCAAAYSEEKIKLCREHGSDESFVYHAGIR